MEELIFVILFNSQLFQYFANRCYIVSVTDVQRTSTEWDASWNVNVAGGRLCMHCEHLWAVDTFNNLLTGMVLVWYVFCLQFKLPLVVWKGCFSTLQLPQCAEPTLYIPLYGRESGASGNLTEIQMMQATLLILLCYCLLMLLISSLIITQCHQSPGLVLIGVGSCHSTSQR